MSGAGCAALGDSLSIFESLGPGGGPVVSVLAFYADNPSLIPAGYFNFLFKKTKINEKRGWGWPIF